MEIGVNFDNTFVELGPLKSRVALWILKKDIPPEKFRRDIIIQEGLMTENEYYQLKLNIYGDKEFGMGMELVDSVLYYLSRLMTDGHTISIVTLRHGIELEIAKEWCFARGIEFDLIGVEPEQAKADVAEGFDAFVDDDINELNSLVGIVPNRFLFSWGYNLDVETSGVATRVKSWEDLYRQIPYSKKR